MKSVWTKQNDQSGLLTLTGAPAGFKNVDAQPVGSAASLREMIRNNIDSSKTEVTIATTDLNINYNRRILQLFSFNILLM